VFWGDLWFMSSIVFTCFFFFLSFHSFISRRCSRGRTPLERLVLLHWLRTESCMFNAPKVKLTIKRKIQKYIHLWVWVIIIFIINSSSIVDIHCLHVWRHRRNKKVQKNTLKTRFLVLCPVLIVSTDTKDEASFWTGHFAAGFRSRRRAPRFGPG